MCTLLTLMTSKPVATLKFAGVPVAPEGVLKNIPRRFGRVFSSAISVPTDYVSESVSCVEVADDLINNTPISVACGVG